MTTRAEIVCLVTEAEQSIVPTALAANACESLVQIRAVDRDGVLQSRPGWGVCGRGR